MPIPAPETSDAVPGTACRNRSLAYILPFLTLMVVLGLGPYLPLRPEWLYPLRTVIVLAVLVAVSRDVIRLKPSRPTWSVLVGIGMFLVWIGPDLIFPAYRQHWIFHGATFGAGSVPPAALRNPAFLIFRVGGAALVVPVVEELFWRAWMMRRLISPQFERVPLGAYAAGSFWITAALFASEHGTYWDVGLAAGVVYNWWMVRTRSLADCILAHGVTNGCLAVYVLAAGQWQYWQ